MNLYEFVRISHLIKYVRIAMGSGWSYPQANLTEIWTPPEA